VKSFDYSSRNETICSPFLIAVSVESNDQPTPTDQAFGESGLTAKSKSPATQVALTAEEEEAIERLREVKGLLEFNEEGRLVSVELAGPGLLSNERRGTNETVAMTSKVASVEKLDLSGSSVTDEGLEVLAKMPKLRWLALNLTSISDDGLAWLKDIKSLERLRLHSTRITDAGLKQFKSLSNLKVLDLSNTAVTDDGLNYLTHLESLEQLDLKNTSVTDEGIKKLKHSLPNVAISRNQG
jgi:Leucine-rich repeat (LRR) protein